MKTPLTPLIGQSPGSSSQQSIITPGRGSAIGQAAARADITVGASMRRRQVTTALLFLAAASRS